MKTIYTKTIFPNMLLKAHSGLNFHQKKIISLLSIFSVCLGLLVIMPLQIDAQTAGPNYPATGANVTGVGTVAWVNPGNIGSNNNVYATVAVSGGAISNYLMGTGFGFAIPSYAVIGGIQVAIGRFENTTGGGADVRDNVVSLVKAGSVTGNNNAVTGTDWPTTEAAVTYGTTSDLWGTTWTPADINATNFGVALAVNSSNNRTASVDYMTITVTYSIPKYFRSNASGNWGTTGTWQQSTDGGTTWVAATTTPTNADGNITIRSGNTVTVAASVSADDMTIDAGGQLTVNASQTFTVADGTGTDLTVNGTIVNAGTLTFTGQVASSATGTIEFNGTSAQTIPVIATPGYGNLTISNNSTKTAGGALDIQGNLTINSTSTFNGGTSLSHNISGNWTNNGTFSYTTASTINFDGNTSSVINGSSATTFNILTINKNAAATTVTSTSKAFTVNNYLTITQGNLILQATDANYTLTNDLTIATNGILTHSVSWDTYGKLLSIGGNIVIDGIFDYTVRSHVQMSSSATKTVRTGSNALSSFSILSLMTGTFNANGPLKVDDNFWAMYNTAGTFHTNGQTVTASSGIMVAGGTFYIDGGTLNVTAGLNVGAGVTNGAAIFSTGTLNADAVNVGDGTRTGTFSMTGGTANLSASLIINSSCTFSCTNSPAINIAGNLTINGTYTKATETITLNGALSQNLGGTGVISLNNLTISNTAGVVLTKDVTINATLAFTNGKITTGANILILANAATISGAGAGKYVNGNLRWTVPNAAAPSKTLEIGDATTYAPVTLTFAGTTSGSGTITAFTVGSENPNIATSTIEPTMDVTRYWSLTNASVAGYTSYSAVFNFNATDLDANSITSSFIVGKYNSTWTYPTVGTKTSTSTQVTGITSGTTAFGTYAIGNQKTLSSVSVQPTAQNICENTTATFSAQSTGGVPTPTATWQISTGASFSDLTITAPYSVSTSTSAGVTTSTLTINATPYTYNSYQYRVIFNNTSGNAISSPAVLTVSQVSLGGAVTGGTSPLCFGSSTGTMTLSGQRGTITKWQKSLNSGSWTDISNTTTSYSEIPSATGTWQYRAEIQNSPCSIVYSTPATIVVDQRPTSVISGSASLCLGQSTTISVALTGTAPWNLTYTDGTTPVTVTGIAASPYTFQVTPASTKTYTVTALSDFDCTAQAADMTGSAVVNINTGCQVVTLGQPIQLSAVISGTTIVPCGTSATITVTITGGTAPYKVTYNGIDHTGASPITFTDTPTSSTVYNSSNVAVTDSHSCGSSITGSANVTVNPLAAPLATDATSVSTSGFTANWNSVASATSYHFDLSTNSSFSSFVSGYNDLNVGTALNKPISGLTAGATYYYRVRAYTATCTSDNSNTKSVTTTNITIGAPTVTGAPFTVDCFTSASGSISFTHGSFNSGNIFTAQLSDNTGSFSTPTNIGTASYLATTMNITIPANTLTGTNSYKIRVVGSDPVVTGSVSSTFTIIDNPCQAIYRSAQSGFWNVPATWDVSTNNGLTWATASQSPTDADGTITIRNGHTVTVNTALGVDELTVEAGGTLVNVPNNDGFINLKNGAGTDLTVNGTWISKEDIDNNGTIVFAAGSLYQHDRVTGKKSPGGFSEIPVASWNANSTCEILSVFGTPYAGLNQSFGNFKWNFTTQSAPINLNGALTNVIGNLIVTSTGSSELQLANTQTVSVSVGGNLTLDGGTLNLSSGSGITTINVSGTAEVKSGAKLITSQSFVAGNGNFTLDAGGNLWIGSTVGITSSGNTGNIQVNGTRSFSTAGNYTYNAAANQVTGSGLPVTINSLGVSTSGGAMLTLTGSSLIATNATIASGAKFQIDIDKQVTVNGTLVNNAGNSGLVIKSSSTRTGSLLHYSANVAATVERYIANDWKWHFLSSPVSSQAIWPEFAPSPSGSPLSFGASDWKWDFYYWNPNTSIESGLYWVNLRKSTGDYNDAAVDIPGSYAGYGTSTPPVMTTGRGYLASYSSDWNPATASPNMHIFTGNLNQGTVTTTIQQAANFFDLVGNPYPSAIDWKAVAGWDRTSLKKNGTSDGYDYWVWNDASANYGAFNSVDPDGSGSNGADRYIAPAQAFFVQVADNGVFSMNNSVRVHSTQNWLKSENFNPGFLRFKLSGNVNSYSDELIISIDPMYTGGGTDKWWSFYNESPELYAVKDNQNYSIDRYNSLDQDLVVNIAAKAGVAGTYTISASNISDFTLSSKVILEDLKTGTTTNLKSTSSYSFTGDPGDDRNRFRLLIGSPTGIDDPISNSGFSIYSNEHTIFVLNDKSKSNYSVTISNMLGQTLQNKVFSGNSLNRIEMNDVPGVYIVNVISEGKSVSKKVVIN
ncbi:MAG: T9SS type A sorting domain-containing protein [Bacteroidetes bacterium]|nr:T9SS type A sorting domain-containing protein [Bacteroidota bacterium]